MNRRGFLKFLGVGAAVAAVAPIALEAVANANPAAPVTATIGSYTDYASFSTLAREEAIDKMVQEAAEQLGRRAGESFESMWLYAFDQPQQLRFDF